MPIQYLFDENIEILLLIYEASFDNEYQDRIYNLPVL